VSHDVGASTHSIHYCITYKEKSKVNSKTIYTNLCSKNKSKKHLWKEEYLHRHHIVPKHTGGSDKEDNFTYLTIREHIIAHYLLWRIYKNPNDLRAMKMLGAKLSRIQRRETGLFCKNNKIGFFCEKFDDQTRAEWRRKGAVSQIKQKSGIHTDIETLRSEWASLGGKAGSEAQISRKIGIHTDNETLRSEWASLGGKAIKGLICVTNGHHRTRIKPELLNQYLEKGYKRGFTLSYDT